MSHRCPTCGTADPIEQELRLYNFRLTLVIGVLYALPIFFGLGGCFWSAQ